MADQDNAAENAVASTGTDDTSAADTTTQDNAEAASTEAVSTDAVAIDASSIDAASTEVAPSSQDGDGDETPARPEQFNAPQPELNDALSPVGNQDDAPRKEVANGRSYEIIFIARVGDDEAVEASTQRLRDLVEGGEGAIDNVRTSEVRRLAYPIQKEMEGIYVVVNGRFAKELTSEIDRFFKLEEAVLRHMILRDDA